MIENIRQSAIRLDDALMDRKNFGPFVETVIEELEMAPADLCDEFPVTVRTVERWVEGIAMPREKTRAQVIARLVSLVMGNAQN